MSFVLIGSRAVPNLCVCLCAIAVFFLCCDMPLGENQSEHYTSYRLTRTMPMNASAPQRQQDETAGPRGSLCAKQFTNDEVHWLHVLRVWVLCCVFTFNAPVFLVSWYIENIMLYSRQFVDTWCGQILPDHLQELLALILSEGPIPESRGNIVETVKPPPR